jgi:hypothetical protein
MSSLKENCDIDVLQDGERLEEKSPDELWRAANIALLQAVRGAEENQPRYVIFNLTLSDILSRVKIPDVISMFKKITIGPITKYFFTPAGAFTDLHHGKS